MTTAFMHFGQSDSSGATGRESVREGRMREVFLTDGNTAVIEARDPYGHWHISWKNGKTPDDVKHQAFTSVENARKFLEIWLNSERYNTKISSQPVVIPELKTKGK